MDSNDNTSTDRLCIYSLRHKADEPLYSIDFLFREEEGKLEWMLFSGGLRGGCYIGKEDRTLYDDINDFIEYHKDFLTQAKLCFPYETVVSYPKLNIGEYYPNIYRPDFSSKLQQSHFIKDGCPMLHEFDEPYIFNYEEYSDYVIQLDIILNELNEVFKVVAPSKENYKSYGNSIRNIIVLACTEIDSMMHNVLVRNGYCTDDDHTSTNDYRLLNEAMMLNEYSLFFADYNHLGEFTPFKDWSSKGGSLSWYNAYNHVKHRRQENFAEANLENAINAVMGFAALLIAQYGCENNLWKRKIANGIRIKKRPYWKLEDYYIPYTVSVKPKPVNYPFSKRKKEESQLRLKIKEVVKQINTHAPKADVLQSIDELKDLVDSEYIEE